jgi:hypothetical protein
MLSDNRGYETKELSPEPVGVQCHFQYLANIGANQQSLAYHQGWMVGGQEILFNWVPVP